MLLFYFDFLREKLRFWSFRIECFAIMEIIRKKKKKTNLISYFWSLSTFVVPKNLWSLAWIYHHQTPLREEIIVITILQIRCKSTAPQVLQMTSDRDRNWASVSQPKGHRGDGKMRNSVTESQNHSDWK